MGLWSWETFSETSTRKHQTTSNYLKSQRNEEIKVNSMGDAVLHTKSEVGLENENSAFLKY